MKDVQVLVIASIFEAEDTDLRVVMVARIDGVTMASPIVTIKDGVACRDGNPYLVYGNAVEEFVGRGRYQTSITVADCRSGDLSGWE
jgi:hypothetical protein